MSVFSKTYGDRISEIRSDVVISSSFAETDKGGASCCALWDTGANASAISNKVAEKLGLVAIDHASVETANGKCEVPIYMVDVMLPEGNPVKRIKVMGTNLNICDALIGMDIITLGDMLITNAPNTRFEFRLPSKGAPSLK
jgi:predicted aspartyl protease